jgi:SAM-dependent methyltransferase
VKDNLTPEEEKTRQFYDASSQVWQQSHNDTDFWSQELTKFHELLPTGHILEVGCGVGRDTPALIAMGYDYTGIDVSTGQLALARAANPGATFLQRSLYELDFPIKFDGFLCLSVLLHIPKARIGEALGALRGSLKPGAVGLITLKEGTGESTEGDQSAGRFFAYWGTDEFQSALEHSGFSVSQRAIRAVGKDRPQLLCFWVRANGAGDKH